MPGPKKAFILGVSLTHLVESRDLFFLEAEVVDNIFQWDALKNIGQIKSYDDMFQAIRVLTIQKILKIILSKKFTQNESFLRLLIHVGCFRQNGLVLPQVFLYMERSKNCEKKYIMTVQKKIHLPNSLTHKSENVYNLSDILILDHDVRTYFTDPDIVHFAGSGHRRILKLWGGNLLSRDP